MEGEAKRHCINIVRQGSDIDPEMSIPEGFRLGIVVHLKVLNDVETLKEKKKTFNYNQEISQPFELKTIASGICTIFT